MDKIKNKGQVMTPPVIVDYMIDLLNLSKTDIDTKIFLDNSCGDGAFIKGLLQKGVPAEHIYACDIDAEISQPVAQLLPKNNLRIGSFFLQQDWINKFDYIIGNPPYVRIHNIEPEVKKQIQDFDFCFGMYDLYYAFYEYGLKCLNTNGVLLYISPSGFIKNASGIKLRNYIEQHHILQYFEDFTHEQKFQGYSTYTCIVKLGKGNNIEIPWSNKREKVGLSINSIQNGLATLADKIFISDSFDLEPECLRPIIKASTGEHKWCIFPPKTEEELMKYPKTYEYLLNHKQALQNRSIKGKTQWFEFGRTQGLKNINNEKIVISTTMSNEGLKIYRVGPEWLVYSGLYATAEDLNVLEKELKSNELIDYLLENGKPMRGGYVQINSTLLKNY